MTSSVKGPGGPGGVTPPPSLAPEKGERRASFRDVSVDRQAGAPEVEALDPVARALLDGSLDAEGAVDALVERAVAQGAAQGLTPEGVEALRAHLSNALREDPALAALVRELESGEG